MRRFRSGREQRDGGTMRVEEVIQNKPYSVETMDTIQRAAQLMKQHNVGLLPVCIGDTLVGVITDRDIVVECVASGNYPGRSSVSSYMTADPVTISPEMEVEEALSKMAAEQVRRLVVADDMRLLGVIALGDIASLLPDDPRVAEVLAEVSKPVRSLGRLLDC
jgi:signal-transduction protein with cAMP-binding, CBS, and nucleotidyltransferase domain